MTFTIRRAVFPQDYPGIAHVLTAESPEWPTTAEALEHDDAVRDPKFHRAVFVALDTSVTQALVVAVAFVGHDPLAHREGKFTMNIRVHPDWQGHGAGSRLYETLLAHLEPLKPQALYTDVWETHPRAVRFVRDRGFSEIWRRIDSHLDVSGFDFTLYAELEETIGALGLEVKSYAELEDDPDRLEKLYKLEGTLWQDVPFGEAVTIAETSLQHYEKLLVQAPDFIPEACFIAIRESAFVGFSHLLQGNTYLITTMTGVLRPYRGKGVATVLKLRGIEYAQAHGNLELRTTNDSVNMAMLSLNAKLGFTRQGATVRFVKPIENLEGSYQAHW